MRPDLIQRWCDPRTILAFVGTGNDSAVLLHAVNEARRSAARLLLVHIVPAMVHPRGEHPDRMLLLSSTHKAVDALDEVALRLQWQGVLCEPMVLRVSSPDDIRSLVRSRNVDRVFLTAPLIHTAGYLFQPDVVLDLMSTLEVPVCIIGPQVSGEAACQRMPGRILLAHSLHSEGRTLVDFGCELARRHRAQLTLLHVIETIGMTEPQRMQAHNVARARLSALVAGRADLPRLPAIAIREGEAASQIVEEELCPWRDLIILGATAATPGLSEWRDKVAHRVVTQSRCPVLAVGVAAVADEMTKFNAPELKTGSLDR